MLVVLVRVLGESAREMEKRRLRFSVRVRVTVRVIAG